MNDDSLVDVLVTHADFVRRLAHGLAGQDGDDLAQDTFVAALHAPPARAGNLRSWLAAVARNLLKNRRRAAVRRGRHEASAITAAQLPAVDEIAEREEVRSRVVAAVLQLPEPLRIVVLLRFYEGLDSRAIGRRLRRPDSTVRTQLSAALERLRRRLDREHGDRRAAWSLPLLRWLPTLRGAALLRVAWPLRAAVVAALLLVAALFAVPPLFAPPGSPPLPPVPVAAAPRANDAAPATPEAERVAASAAAAAPSRGPEDLWGRVVRAADGAPVAGADVQLLRCDGDEFESLDVDYTKRIDQLARTQSDAEGRFAFAVARSLHHRLRVVAAGCAPATEFDCTGGTEILVRVALGASVEGVVTEAEQGRPLRDEPVALLVKGRWDELAATTTADDGSFRFDNVPACTAYAIARPADRAAPEWQEIELRSGSVHPATGAVPIRCGSAASDALPARDSARAR
jgi:RNA polymerase sigma-70 factor (ECF subfamily)